MLPLDVEVDHDVVLCELHLLRLLLIKELTGLGLRLDPRHHRGQAVLQGFEVLLILGEELSDPLLCMLDALLVLGLFGIESRVLVVLLVIQVDSP